MKAVLRIEQPDAISNVMDPLKQWLFGGSDPSNPAAGSPMEQMAGTGFGQMANSLFTAAAAATSSQAAPQPLLGNTKLSRAAPILKIIHREVV